MATSFTGQPHNWLAGNLAAPRMVAPLVRQPGRRAEPRSSLTKFGGLGRRLLAGGRPGGSPAVVAGTVRTSADNCVGPVARPKYCTLRAWKLTPRQAGPCRPSWRSYYGS